MRPKLRQLILATFLLSASAQAASGIALNVKAQDLKIRDLKSLSQVRGTESGGGGGVLMRASQPVLLDFLRIDLNFQDPTSYQGVSPSRVSTTEQSFVLNSQNAAKVRELNSAFDLALGTLEKWQNLKFDLAGTWAASGFYDPVTWSFTNANLTAPVSLPKGVSAEEKTGIAAYYLAKMGVKYGVQISIPLWNQLGIVSQSGILVHEALRHLQIGMIYNFDERSLQQSTAIFMMCKPKARLGYYVRYLLLNSPEMAEQLYGPFEDFIQKDCERVL